VELPRVSAETWRAITNWAGQQLTDVEQARITSTLAVGAPTGAGPTFARGPQFVLHDTAATISAAGIASRARDSRGPLGEGAAAWVPRSGAETVARPNFFDPRRPATSQFERGQDILDKAAREHGYRQVWSLSSATAQTVALDRALAGLNLTAAEVTAERTAAQAQLSATSGDVRTTASWAVRELCQAVSTAGVGTVAASTQAQPALQTACAGLAPLLRAREERLGSMVNVEIVQEQGGTPRAPTPLPSPAYTPTQYQAVARLYLQATLQARRWPEITTHFLIDRGVGDHTDPRCFNLGELYHQIQLLMHHPVGARYGITPSYGTAQTNNIWWTTHSCGGPPPP
jgi:hypothetical protein